MNKRFTRLTALLLALLMLMSTAYASGTGVTKGQYNDSVTKMIDDLSLIPVELEEPKITTIKVDTTTLVPTYKEGAVTPESSIAVKANTAPEATNGYQWMIFVGGVWAKIDGATEQTLNLTYAMAKPAMDEKGEVQLRCRLFPATETASEGAEEAVYEDTIVLLVDDTVTYTEQPGEMEIQITEYMQNEEPDAAYNAAWAFQNAAKTSAVSTFAVARDTMADELDDYSIVINYVFENGDIVADPYTASLAAGSNFSAKVSHPTIQGYLPYIGEATETSTEIELNITNIQADVTYTVTYKPTLVNYTVIHYQQNLDNDKYTIKETKTLQGLTKSTVPEVANTYEGFYKLLYEKPEIAADGSTVVEIYYDRNYYLMLFDLGGGYGVEPIYARYGAAIGNIAAPTRAGYTFIGWSLDGTTRTTLPDTMPAENLTYTALWQMNEEANVTLVFWGENADDTGYSPLPSKTVTTKPGTEFTYNENGSLICGKEAHTHSAACGYDCGYDEHSHSLADNCYKLTCTQTSHNHVNDGCTLDCKHEHDLSCYSAAYGKLVESSRPNQTLTDRGNGIYTYTTTVLWEKVTHYYVNIGDKWYCSDSRLGDVITISLNCSHSHGDECYTCGQKNSTHVHTIDGGCYELDCQIPPHSHTVDCYACGKAEHSHSSGCYMAGAGLDSNLWVFEKSDTVTVAADGSSVVNVYYKRTTKTLTFKYNYNNSYRTTETITAKWGADISDKYVAIAKNCGSTFWSAKTSGDGPYTNYFGIMPKTSATYYHRSANGSNGSMMYYGQDLTGDYNVKLFQVDNVGGYKVTVEDRYEFEGFTYHHGTSTGSSCSGATFYYTRNVYDIEFYNPTEQISKVEDVYYEAPLGDYDFTPTPDQAPDSYEPGSVEFEGWYLNPECTGEKYILANHTMPVGAVNGEVALTLYAKWKPVNRTVSFYLDRTKYDAKEKLTSHPDVTVPHGSKVEPIPATPTKGDYTFVGWFYEEDGVEKAFDFKNMPVTENLKVYGKWSSNVLKEYIVYFKIKDTDTPIADPITGSGLAGITKTFDAKGDTDLYTGYQEGYFPLVKSHSMTLDINTPKMAEDQTEYTDEEDGNTWTRITNEDGTTKIVQSFTFWYVQKDEVPYTVYYVTETQNDAGSLTSITLDGKTYYIVADTENVMDNRKAVVTEKFKVVGGYMPDAYQKRLVVTTGGTDANGDGVEDQNKIIFIYSVDTTHAYYKITHYTQNTDGKTYTEYASSQAVGLINETYSADPMTIGGFTYNPNAEGTVVSGVLTPDGLELKLYYDRNEYPYEVRYLEQGTGKQLAEPKINGKGLYGEVISENAIDIENYTPKAPTSQTLTIKIEESQTEAKLNIITFYYVENEVTINYEVIGPEGCGTVDRSSETVKVLSDTAQGSEATPSSNVYKFVGWYDEEGKLVGTDAEFVPEKVDGKNVAATYYAKFEYNLTELTVEKAAEEGTTIDADAMFIFEVRKDTTLVARFALKSGESVTLGGLTVGDTYTVTEITSWSVRYTPVKSSESIELTADKTKNKVTITNEDNNNDQWLDDESAEKNVFAAKN